jgi:hypothetical protein
MRDAHCETFIARDLAGIDRVVVGRKPGAQ